MKLLLSNIIIYSFIYSTFYQMFTKWVRVYWVCIKQSVTCICMFGRVPIYCELIIVSEGQMPDREFTSLRTYLQATDWYPDAANNEIIMSPAHFDNFGYQRALSLTNKYEFTVINLKLQIREGRISSFSSHLHSSCTRERFNINMVRLFSYSNIVHCY